MGVAKTLKNLSGLSLIYSFFFGKGSITTFGKSATGVTSVILAIDTKLFAWSFFRKVKGEIIAGISTPNVFGFEFSIALSPGIFMIFFSVPRWGLRCISQIGNLWIRPGKVTFWTQSHGGLVQMIFLFNVLWCFVFFCFRVNFQGCTYCIRLRLFI